MKRYRVVTFRGYEETEELDQAVEKGLKSLDEIQRTFKDSTIWWVRIEDKEKGILKLITSCEPGQLNSTHWIR